MPLLPAPKAPQKRISWASTLATRSPEGSRRMPLMLALSARSHVLLLTHVGAAAIWLSY